VPIIKAKVIQAKINKPNFSEAYTSTADGLDAASLEATSNEAQSIIEAARSEAERQAAAIMAEAEAKAIEVRNHLIAEKEKLEDQYSKLDELREQGYQEGLNEAEEIKDELLKMLSGFQNAKAKVLHEAEEEIASIALSVAQKLIQSEIKRDKSSKAVLTKLIRAATSKVVTGKGLVKILVNTADMQHAKSIKTALAKVLEEGVNLVFEPDETIEPASCIIETKGGRFDASFHTQIKVISVALEKYLGHKLVDLDERYQEDTEMQVTVPKSNQLSHEPSDADLDALLTDIQTKKYFADDEDLQAKHDDDYDDDDLDQDDDDDLDDEDSDDDDLVDEDEDDLGAVDDDLLIDEDSDADDPFADGDSEDEGDERFPEY